MRARTAFVLMLVLACSACTTETVTVSTSASSGPASSTTTPSPTGATLADGSALPASCEGKQRASQTVAFVADGRAWAMDPRTPDALLFVRGGRSRAVLVRASGRSGPVGGSPGARARSRRAHLACRTRDAAGLRLGASAGARDRLFGREPTPASASWMTATRRSFPICRPAPIKRSPTTPVVSRSGSSSTRGRARASGSRRTRGRIPSGSSSRDRTRSSHRSRSARTGNGSGGSRSMPAR